MGDVDPRSCTSRRPFRGAMGSSHALLVVLLVAHACVPVHALENASKWIRIPLKKTEESYRSRRLKEGAPAAAAAVSSDVIRDVRLAYQLERVRRRTQAEDGGSSSSSDEDLLEHVNATVKMPIVYSEVPLGVGFGCVYA